MKRILLLLLMASGVSSAQKSQAEIPQFLREDPFYKVVGLDKMWTVEVSAQKISYISILPNESFEAPFKSALVSGNQQIFKSGTKDRSIEIKCTPKSALWDDVSLVVTGADGQARQLSGTGQYIPDDRLNVVWILREMGGKRYTVQDFGKELPYMDLHIHDGFFTGFAGCNRVQGKLRLEEDCRIALGEVSGSRMQCNAANKEPLFIEMLKRVNRYEIRKGRLYLFGAKGLEAIFDPGT